MAVITTFLTGAVVGGGGKWLYDRWKDGEKETVNTEAIRSSIKQAPARTVEAAKGVRDKSAEKVRNLRKSSAELIEPAETPAAES